ncbi:hypothetical protein [Ralstonia pseudosolanacearum]|uniref:hypothetical protein n=1 Tax=Ralstonia pseudosolanacearum TaxID=1310165 RepID=UPI002234135E|nr:hypothetical protein [Ralstonia sp. RS642]UZF25780.1 hypothetical protein LGV80_04305 [Ralstonia sp. RS642]
MRPLQWLVEHHFPGLRTVPQFAQHDLPARAGLEARITEALQAYPCEVLFVHRDAEREPYDTRVLEIENVMAATAQQHWIPVVPVRMTEAWLLGSEEAIRSAVGNRNGRISLGLPNRSQWERLPDAKETLFECIRTASELRGRRLASLQVRRIRQLVAQYTEDFGHLRGMESFDVLERHVVNVFGQFG